MLPHELLRLPAELERVDALLDDPAFFAPFVSYFDPRIGRPSTPMETHLRLMFLEVPLPTPLREAVSRGERDSLSVAAVAPSPLGRVAAAPNHIDEDHPLRRSGGGRAERGC